MEFQSTFVSVVYGSIRCQSIAVYTITLDLRILYEIATRDKALAIY